MAYSNVTRRSFIKHSGAISVATAYSSLAVAVLHEEKPEAHWKALR